MLKLANKPGSSSAVLIYQKLLLSKKEELQLALEISFRRLATKGEQAEADQEQLLQEESVGVRLNRVLYLQLRQVREALERLDRGEYGRCLACGNRITTKRLVAVPWTRLCLPCQEQASSLGFSDEMDIVERSEPAA